MIKKSIIIGLAFTFVTFLGCGDDDNGSEASGGTETDTRDDAGSGGTETDTGGESGTGGTVGDQTGVDTGPLAICLEKMAELPAAPEACETCICEHCSQEVAECAADEGCMSIDSCVRDKACTSESDCYMPDTCQEVIDEVGVGSLSVDLSIELRDCTEAAACSCPWISDPEAGGTFTISGTVVEFMTYEVAATGEEAPPVQYVEVCVFENDELCTTTDAEGTFTLQGAPSNTEFYISFTKEGYRPDIWCITERSEDLTISIMLMVPDTVAEENAEAVGASYPDRTTGSLVFWAVTQNDSESDSVFVTRDGEWRLLSGVTFSLQPDSGARPFYENSDEKFDPSLSETGEPGFGAFFNLEPGEYTLSVSHPTLNCLLVAGQGGAPEIVRIEAEYYTTGLGAVCM